MVSFSATFLAIALLAISQFSGVAAIPLTSSGKESKGISARGTPAAPHWVIYSDKWETRPPPASQLSGFNTFILGFYLIAGPADNVIGWTQLSADERASIKKEYAAAGISLMISAFGSTEQPVTSGVDPVAMANKISDFVIQYGLDGVDVDFEDFPGWNAPSGPAVPWLITLTKTLRQKLPVGQYIVSHAPIGPWFTTVASAWPGGGYNAIHKAAGDLIDFYNMQYYSQEADQYVDCTGLLDKSTRWPGSTIFELGSAGIPLSKLVIGKPATPADASDYMNPSDLAVCLSQAKGRGWNGGAMIWQYPNAGSDFITIARSKSWPVGQNTPPPPTTTTTSHTTTTPSSPTTTTTPGGGSGSCASAPAWVNNVAYTGGTAVTYNGHLYVAKWWTFASVPSGSAGDWTDKGPCSASKRDVFATAASPHLAPRFVPTVLPVKRSLKKKSGQCSTSLTTPTPTTTSKTTSSPTSTPTPGGCSGVAAYDSKAVYVGGDKAVYQGSIWQAKWWTQGDLPGGQAGVWVNNGPCSS